MRTLAWLGAVLVILASATVAGCKGKSLPGGREVLPVSDQNAAENNNPVETEANKGKAPTGGPQAGGRH